MGALLSYVHQHYPPTSKFSVDDIPDLSGKVVVVTGGNTGIGYETAKALLNHNAKVYIACRSKTKGDQAITKLQKECDGKLAIFHFLDLADLSAIKRSAQSFLEKEKELHILFNSAGVMQPPADQLTKDGYDLTLGVNVLGPFYFTTLVLPALLAVGTATPDDPARVVNTSSFASELSKKIDYTTFKDGQSRKKAGAFQLYNDSKFGNVLFSNELARRYGDKGIVSTALHPGDIQTELAREVKGIGKFLITKMLYPAPMGALTQLYAGTSPEGKTFNGKYLVPWARLWTPNPATQDPKMWEELWTFLEKQVKDVA